MPNSPPTLGSATLSWYPPTQNVGGSALKNLAGYRIYYGQSARTLNQAIKLDNPGLTRYVVENLSPARWHFAMTSVNSAGRESRRTEIVSKIIG
ncbi:MAG: fibronectin type III domain-containing protein [Woeseiaceae bacterium]